MAKLGLGARGVVAGVLALAALGAGTARASSEGAGTDLELGLRPNGPSIGAAVLVGGGVGGFTHPGARGAGADIGGFWNVRFLWGSRHTLGVEAAYIGTAQALDALGLQSTAWLLSNGAEGVLRLNVLPVVRGELLFEPFVIAGVGYAHYEITRTTIATSDVASSDDVLKVPVGGGFAFGYYAFMADLRFTYRASFYDDLFRATSASQDTWSMGAQVGVQF